MKSFLSNVEKFHRKIEGAVVFLSGLIVIFMLTIICSEVILRALFRISVPGVFEMSSQMMVAISLLGISYVQQKREHITIDLISDKVPALFNKISNIIIYVIGILITIVYSWQGWISFYNSWQTQEYTLGIVQFPLWPGKLAVALSMTIIAVRYLLDLINEISSFSSQKRNVQASAEESF